MEFLSLYGDFVRIKFKAMVEYPGAFWATFVAKAMGWSADVILLYLMIRRFSSIMAWSTYEIVLLYAMNVIAYGLAGFFMFHPFTKLEQHVRNGTFDEMLTKPLNPFLYLCCREFSTGYIPNVLVGVTAAVIAFVHLDVALTADKIAFFVVALFSGALIHSSVFIFVGTPAFWLTKVTSLGSLRYTLEQFVQYPISIYGEFIQVLLTFVVPFAFVNFYPAQFVLDKTDLLGFPPVLIYLSPAVGVGLFVLAVLFFRKGLRDYKSTGS